jgi:hypothetical protein
MRVKSAGAAAVGATVIAMCAGFAPDGSVAASGNPGLYFAGIRKKPNAPVKKRFVLLLFTKDAKRGRDGVSAQKGRAEAFADFHGHNHTYQEWRIGRNDRKGPKVIRRIRKALQRRGRVSFFGYVYPEGATAPFRFKCRLTDFNDTGSCTSIVTPL